MRLPRFTTRRLMVIVAVAAVMLAGLTYVVRLQQLRVDAQRRLAEQEMRAAQRARLTVPAKPSGPK